MRYFVFWLAVLCSALYAQIYISEVSDALNYNNEFIELYNNSNNSIDLTGYKLIRVDAATNSAEYVYDIGTNESGTGSEMIIPAYGFMIIDRGNDKATFESEWGTLSPNVAFNNGNTLLYFGATTARRWRLRANDGTADTDDGTLIDDTGQAVGGSGNRHYQQSPGGSWILDSYTNATPGAFDADQSLPVVLSLFKAVIENGRVTLEWRTESEIDNVGFEIFRAIDVDGPFQLIDSFRNNHALRGHLNSSSAHDYRFVDYSALPGNTYYYRLTSCALDGKREVLGMVKVELFQEQQIAGPLDRPPETFRLYSAFPNPFNPSTTLTFDLPQARTNYPQKVELNIFDINGRKVCCLVNRFFYAGGRFHVQWNGTDGSGRSVPGGVYFALLKTTDAQQSVKLCLIR